MAASHVWRDDRLHAKPPTSESEGPTILAIPPQIRLGLNSPVLCEATQVPHLQLGYCNDRQNVGIASEKDPTFTCKLQRNCESSAPGHMPMKSYDGDLINSLIYA
jgi:hypothetical protein